MGGAADEAMEKVKSALTSIRNTLIGFTVATAAGSAGLLAIVKSAANVGDEINKTAPMLGFTVEEFQKYRYAAKLAGVENENFAGTVQLLLRNVSEAQKGNDEIAKSFARVGISAESLKNLSTDQVLRRISDGLAKIPNQADRIAVSMDLMGRSGARMGEFLAKGTSEMDALMGDVEAFGMFTEETAKNSEDLNDAWDRVAFFIRGIKNEFIALSPIFTGILNDMREWLSAHRAVIQSGLAKAIDFIGRAITKAWNITKKIVRGFETMIGILGGLENAFWLLGVAILTPIIMLLGPMFALSKGLRFLSLRFLGVNLVIGAVASTIGAIIPLFTLLTAVITSLLVTKFVGWLISLAGGFRLLATSMIVPVLSFLALAAAIAFVILLFDDLTTWILGGKSLIGEWLGPWEALPEKFKKIWADIKAIFAAGGKFMSAVFRGDFAEAYKILEAGAEKVKKAGTGKQGASQQNAGQRYQSYTDLMGGYGLPGGTAFAGASSGKREHIPFSGRKFVEQYSLGTGVDGKPALVERTSKSGSTGTKIGKVEMNISLAKGTTQEQAEEITQLVDKRLSQHIDHSLQQSSGPGE